MPGPKPFRPRPKKNLLTRRVSGQRRGLETREIISVNGKAQRVFRVLKKLNKTNSPKHILTTTTPWVIPRGSKVKRNVFEYYADRRTNPKGTIANRRFKKRK